MAEAEAPVDAEAEIVKAACPHDCPDTCAMHITVRNEGGKRVAIKVAGDPAHPTTAGTLCTKVSRYLERTYHAERLLHPLKRVGAKGSGKFVRVSWDQALGDIAARLQAIAARDPQRIVPYSYAGTMGLVQGESMAARFFNKLGASFLDRTICSSAGAEAMTATLGTRTGPAMESFADAKLILFWGCNAVTSNLHLWSFAQEAKRRGAKLIAIDPYRSLTAEKCHQHIALMPGTDGALALGMMHVMLREGWLDHDYIEQYTLGFDALAERAQTFDPAKVAGICGITTEEIENLARDYRQIRPAAIRLNYGMQRARGGGNAVRAISCLPALAGHWRDAAGGVLLSTSGMFARDNHSLQRPELLAGQRPRTINMSTIGRDLQSADPPIEALVVYNSNPVAVAPDSGAVAAGFAREDLFTVVLEHFQTDTADYADYVLPATTQLEHLDVHAAYGHLYMLANNAAIDPLGEALPNTEIFRRLAKKMGYVEECFSESDDSIAAHAYKKSGATANFDWERLKRSGWERLAVPEHYAPFANGGFPTPSGKCEFWSEALRAIGVDPLPDYVAPYESASSQAELAQRFPLALISPPARNFLNSTFVNVQSLRDTDGEPTLDVHPADASARQLFNDSDVRVFNDRGEFRARLRITEKARTGCVVALSIWWKKLAPDGKNANEVTHQRLTDIGRAPSFYDCLVEIRRYVKHVIAWMRRHPVLLALALLAMLATAGCSTIGYYSQSIQGHMAMMDAARPIAQVVADPATAPALRERLKRAQSIRAYASRELGLPDNASYTRYADLKRQFVIWNVVATPELSMELKQWCYPVVGCATYRGYFKQQDADDFAATLRAEKMDVSVGGVPAYSTLGWFADPLLNTFIGNNEGELARLIFHELAHQVLYVSGDSTFNESFATAVEREGLRRWLRTDADQATQGGYAAVAQRRSDFLALLLSYRARLATLYDSSLSADMKRDGKSAVFVALKKDYAELKVRWGGFAGYDRFFAQDLSNAQLAAIATYNDWVPAFNALLAQQHDDLPAFFNAVKELTKLPKDERDAALRALAPGATPA